MELGIIALNQIVSMFIIIFVGAVCYKVGMIDKNGNKVLSAIVLNVVNAALIFNSYQKEFDKSLAMGLLYTVILCAVSYIIAIPVSYAIIGRKNNDYFNIERVSTIYSNCGFMGIPLINAVLGDAGVFFASVYVTVFNIMLWTNGLMIMTGKTEIKGMAKSLITPCLIAVVVGLLCFFANIRVSQNVYNAIGFIADMNTPLAMLVAGVTIAQTNLLKAFTNLRIYFISFVKLILIPMLVVLSFYLFKNVVEYNIIMTVIIATACPTAASGFLFAIRFGGNELYASEIFGVTTLLSAVTLPLIITFADLLLF